MKDIRFNCRYDGPSWATKRVRLPFLGMMALGLLSIAAPCVFGAEAPYRLVKEIPVGGEGGWDYLSIDASARRLYVTHSGMIVVVDIDKEAVTGGDCRDAGRPRFRFGTGTAARILQQRPGSHGQHRGSDDPEDACEGDHRGGP